MDAASILIEQINTLKSDRRKLLAELKSLIDAQKNQELDEKRWEHAYKVLTSIER